MEWHCRGLGVAKGGLGSLRAQTVTAETRAD